MSNKKTGQLEAVSMAFPLQLTCQLWSFTIGNMDQSPHNEAHLGKLEGRIQVLRSLCQEIDPYTPLKSEVREQLKELGIDDGEDPFALTNRLLLLMEDALEEFHKLNKAIKQ